MQGRRQHHISLSDPLLRSTEGSKLPGGPVLQRQIPAGCSQLLRLPRGYEAVIEALSSAQRSAEITPITAPLLHRLPCPRWSHGAAQWAKSTLWIQHAAIQKAFSDSLMESTLHMGTTKPRSISPAAHSRDPQGPIFIGVWGSRMLIPGETLTRTKNVQHLARPGVWEETIPCSLHKWPLAEKQWNYTDDLETREVFTTDLRIKTSNQRVYLRSHLKLTTK